MEQLTTREALLQRWAEVCNDPRFHDQQAKFELNGYGVIEMSPANNRHARRQSAISNLLNRELPEGATLVECSILTTDGVRVPDVAWASADFMARHADATPFPRAPEICVEVRSPSNTTAEMGLKTRLFLEAGAVEVWIVAEDGSWQVFDADGGRLTSHFGVKLDFPAV